VVVVLVACIVGIAAILAAGVVEVERKAGSIASGVSRLATLLMRMELRETGYIGFAVSWIAR
jgi:hypothetical protein